MAHYPVNHALRPVYRVATFLIGVYVLIFGIIGVTRNWGEPLFGRHGTWVLGLRTNLAFALLSLVMGAAVAGCAIAGRRYGHFPLIVLGWVFVAGGLLNMLVLQTGANILNFSMVNVIASLIFGLICVTAGMYGLTGDDDAARAADEYRRGGRPQAQTGARGG
jgi:Domain of unknown function (DUF4383)